MLSINTNISSLIAQSSMKNSTNSLNLAIERMTTGFKINHAKDNAANYSISTKMTTKIGAYEVAEDNASMGLDMLTTAQDNIAQMQTHAERLRTLAIQARNETYGAKSLDAIQTEANAITEEIERLHFSANFNGVKLFDKFDINDKGLTSAKSEYNQFITNPVDYTKEEVEAMTDFSAVDKNTRITSGTYSISTAEELAKFSEMSNKDLIRGGIYVLKNNIDLEKYSVDEGWIPIANFSGTFNGNGHKIINLKINRPNTDKQGLFASSNAGSKIKNLALEDVDIIGKEYTGALLGIGGSTIINCYATGSVIGNNSVGGLVGRHNYILESSYSLCKVTGNKTVGGLVGDKYYNTVDSFSDGEIVGKNNVGGLFGSTNYETSTIENSYSLSSVSGDKCIGGIVGMIAIHSGTVALTNVHSFSSVNGNNFVGSFTGTINISDDGSSFGSITLSNCESIKNESIIGDTTIGRYLPNVIPNYDESELLKNIKIINYNTNFQVGIFSGCESSISSILSYDRSILKNLNNIDISKDTSIECIDIFLEELSKKQTQLGSTLNRLESVLEEITIQRDNLVSSRSTIRDADIANVSSQYIQQQILQQAASTLLATANQSPSIALQLI